MQKRETRELAVDVLVELAVDVLVGTENPDTRFWGQLPTGTQVGTENPDTRFSAAAAARGM